MRRPEGQEADLVVSRTGSEQELHRFDHELVEGTDAEQSRGGAQRLEEVVGECREFWVWVDGVLDPCEGKDYLGDHRLPEANEVTPGDREHARGPRPKAPGRIGTPHAGAPRTVVCDPRARGAKPMGR